MAEYIMATITIIALVGLLLGNFSNVFNNDYAVNVDNDAIEDISSLVEKYLSVTKSFKKKGAFLSLNVVTRKIKSAFLNIEKKILAKEQLFGFEHWIYDNYYKIAENLDAVKKNRRQFFYLPHCRRVPRVYVFFVLLLNQTNGEVDFEYIKRAFTIINKQVPFEFREIVLLKASLTFALTNCIANLCDKSIEIANNIKIAREDAKNNDINIAKFENLAYITTLYKFSTEENQKEIANIVLLKGNEFFLLEEKFNKELVNLESQTKTVIKSIHKLPVELTDNKTLSLSKVYQIFNNEKAVLFSELTDFTKHYYLSRIAKLAKKHKVSEEHIAKSIIKNSAEKNADIAYFIIEVPKSRAVMRLYIGIYYLLTFSFCIISAIAFWGFIAPVFAILTSVFLFPISFYITSILLKLTLKHNLKRRELPAVNSSMSDRIGKAVIVVPRLILKKEEITDAFRHIETIICANPNPIFSYAVVFDFKESKVEVDKSDNELFSECVELYKKSKFKNCLSVFVRKRSYCEEKKNFVAYEKKRGALLDFNDAILNQNHNKFSLVLGHVADDVKYAITLDCDTQINDCLSLVEYMSHPYQGDVNVLSINMCSLPPEKQASLFERLFCGNFGYSRYGNNFQSVNFEWFEKGNFTGKGIYNIEKFQASVNDKFMNNKILCHDFIEGAVVGCKDTSVVALDNFPKSFSQFFMRELRWTRGDWQLLPFLFSSTKNRLGVKVKNTISPIDKASILFNIIRPLIPIASLVLVILSLFSPLPVVFILMALIPYIVPLVFSLLNSVFRLNNNFFKEFLRQTFLLAALPSIAMHYLIAIIVTIFRLLRGKKLLEWKTFFHQSGSIILWHGIIVGAGVIVATILFNLPILFYILGSIFILGFLFEIIISKSQKLGLQCTVKERVFLSKEFKKVYGFFVDALVEKYNYLPYDNIQYEPSLRIAERTSPTNIGFALASHICAYMAEIIDYKTLDDRLEKIISTVERLEKWRGNLFNWYDIMSLKVLFPRYVSSVDSGNFLLCLVLVASIVKGELKDRVRKLIENTDIASLFDNKRGLFRIGFREESSEFDETHYDLLASEALGTYLIAIGLGKIDKRAFYNLSSQSYKYAGIKTLSSWTGGMFEYLMPNLFFDYKPKVLLNRSGIAGVKAQIKFAKKTKMALWGVSESQYDKVDENDNYQYKAHGIPNIALSNAECPTVISSYSSYLALPIKPSQAINSLVCQTELGINGRYGHFEAYDLKTQKVLKTYMSHHLGMSLVALTNFLYGNVVIKSLKNEPSVRAVELLIADSGKLNARKKHKECLPIEVETNESPIIIEGKNKHLIPQVNLLKDNNYALVVNENGGGYAMIDELVVYRENSLELKLELDSGKIQDLLGGTCIFTNSFCEFNNISPQINSATKIELLQNGLGELYTITLHNKTPQTIGVVLTSKIEPLLRDAMGDIGHRAFSDLFLVCELGECTNAPIMHRINAKLPKYITHSIVDVSQKYERVYNTHRPSYYKRVESELKTQARPTEPVISSHTKIILSPKSKTVIKIATLVADAKEKLQLSSHIETVSKNQFNGEIKNLASKLLYASRLEVKPKIALDNWNKPIMALVKSHDGNNSDFKKQLNNFKKLYSFGLNFDLYILYAEKYSYYRKEFERIEEVLDEIGYRKFLANGSNVYLLNKLENPQKATAVLERCIIKKGISNKILSKKHLKVNSVITNGPDIQKESAIKAIYPIASIEEDYSYFVDITNGDTPRPHCNILANKKIGSIISESGGGFSFYDSSYYKKITHWSNDSVLDVPSEFVVLKENEFVWSITKKPYPITHNKYYARHSLGFSEFMSLAYGINSKQTVFLHTDLAIKFFEITLENKTDKKRAIDIAFSIKAVLGDFSKNNTHSVFAEKHCDNTLKITNLKNNLSVYLICSQNLSSFEIQEFITINTKVFLNSNDRKQIYFALSQETSVDFSNINILKEKLKSYYQNLSSLQILGNSNEAIISKWLPYQVLNSRYLAKAGFYQAGGAVGFRDQLQDSLALLYIDPDLTREHILLASARQFEKGDVLHWWHPKAIGVRTKMTDDRLFLPLVVAEYIAFTGDNEILHERIPYLIDKKIPNNQHDLYADFEFTGHKAPLVEHCIKAIEVSCDFGDNGLCLMGTGDWNDAMDKVGEFGKGTSMFTSMLLYMVITKFAPYIKDRKTLTKFLSVAQNLKKAINFHFMSDRFIRAIADNGDILGSEESAECKLDLLVQSFAVLSGAGDKYKSELGLNLVLERLVDEKNGIVKLLSPPIQKMQNVGYIANYPPGVRENGGQYTHATAWFILALLEIDKIEDAYKVFSMINPLNLTDTPEKFMRYKNEPYVISADIYTNGQGGWSWYTGAASWYYKAWVEGFLGIKKRGDKVSITPKLPKEIEETNLILSHKEYKYFIKIDNSNFNGEWQYKIDGIVYIENIIELTANLADKQIIVKKVSACKPVDSL